MNPRGSKKASPRSERTSFISPNDTPGENVGSRLPSPDESVRIKRGYMDGAEPTHSDLLLQETGRRRYRAIVESLNAVRPESVLDLGCGEGNLADMISNEGLKIKLLLGCDLDRAKLRKAAGKQFRDGRVAYIMADAENLPLKPGSFAMVVATEILEHVPDETRCLAELRRLAPNQILLTVPALHYPMFLFAVGSERLDAWIKKDLRSSTALSRVLKAILRMSEGPGSSPFPAPRDSPSAPARVLRLPPVPRELTAPTVHDQVPGRSAPRSRVPRGTDKRCRFQHPVCAGIGGPPQASRDRVVGTNPRTAAGRIRPALLERPRPQSEHHGRRDDRGSRTVRWDRFIRGRDTGPRSIPGSPPP